jgi:hypothetical protein
MTPQPEPAKSEPGEVLPVSEERRELERVTRAIGFDREGLDADEWRERWYNCTESRERLLDKIERYREALQRIAEWHEVDVNGEYTKREPLSGYEASNIAKEALNG